MVVRRGEEWGTSGVPCATVPVASSDADANRLLRSGCREFIVAFGDMARTVGAVRPTAASNFRRLPLDLVRVSLIGDDSNVLQIPVFSHCLIRSSHWRGGILSGPIIAVCNAQFIGGRDVAPRGHPNDGKVEIVEFDSALKVRERLQILRRMRNGSHLPHPSISVHQIASGSVHDARGVLIVDGVRSARFTLTGVEVLPDAITVWAALPSTTNPTQPQR